MKDALVTLPDDRQLACTDIGDPAGAPVFFFHGAPDCRLSLVSLEPEFASRGLRVISPDRPGYGRSSPQPGRSLADWPLDIAAAADALGLDRFVVVSYSSGGPYGLACAFRQGVVGYAQDVFVQGRPWPFASDTIARPVVLAHGDDDSLVPLDHSRHTAGLIPGSELRVLSGHGHLTILMELPDLCAELDADGG